MPDPERKRVQINADAIINGRPHRKCPNCSEMKDLDEFGLRNKTADNVVANQSWCRTCR